MQIVERNIREVIWQYADKYPVLAVTGPRQSGKTTLLKTLFPEHTYLNLENPDLRDFAKEDPNGFFNFYSGNLLIDEAQQAPQIFSYIQTLADASGKMGQFVLSGSQNFQLLQGITQSLAGRVAIFKLLPFDLDEMSKAGLLPDEVGQTVIKGAYPAIYHRNIDPRTFYSNYIQTYIERDITDVLRVRDTSLFRKFLSLCATRAGQLTNLNGLANECGISQPTANAWLSVLQSSFIIFLLRPYHTNLSKRLIKTPKLYFYDTGLLCHLLRMTDPQKLPGNGAMGSLFENLMVAELVKQNHHRYRHSDLWFWRDKAGKEVDVIIENDTGMRTAEIKATQTITNELFKGLSHFNQTYPTFNARGTLVHSGSLVQERSLGKVLGWRNVGDLLEP